MQKRIDRLIDEALLLTATQTGMLYIQRRSRRALPKVAAGTAVLAGVGAAAATAAAGVGTAFLAGGALVWYRKREGSRAALPRDDGASFAGTQPNIGDRFQRERASDPATTHG
jgi:hypothetical protein